MAVNIDPRRKAELPNFGMNEGQCKCGCGLKISDELTITLQAFLFFLNRKYSRKFWICLTSGARCPKHNKEVGGAIDSQHQFASAVDCTIKYKNTEGITIQLPNETVAREAADCGLFGGIGQKRYEAQKKNLVHLDIRPGAVAILW